MIYTVMLIRLSLVEKIHRYELAFHLILATSRGLLIAIWWWGVRIIYCSLQVYWESQYLSTFRRCVIFSTSLREKHFNRSTRTAVRACSKIWHYVSIKIPNVSPVLFLTPSYRSRTSIYYICSGRQDFYTQALGRVIEWPSKKPDNINYIFKTSLGHPTELRCGESGFIMQPLETVILYNC